jgi:hypothetical protein
MTEADLLEETPEQEIARLRDELEEERGQVESERIECQNYKQQLADLTKPGKETVARWIVRQRKDGTRYWYGRLAWDEGKFEQETLTCNASDFEVGTVVLCREPQVKHE